MLETEKAYVAGFVDGEGCVTIMKKRKPGGTFAFQVHLIVTNTDAAVLKRIRKMAGRGKIYVNLKWSGYRKNWKPVHRLELWSENAKGLLREILPYLIVKKRVAQEVLKLRVRKGGAKRTPAQLRTQDACYSRVKRLNRRGKDPGTN